ncbi:hypothetical protein ACIQ4Z_08135 [Peribacillus asahii]|uniref:hypothetical protein n=1 Tax=Peribacillus asahii TaxID=228899 RepID=UPI00380B42A6
MQTSVVIGAYQFVGFHLAKYLLDQGEEVLGVDWEDVSGESIEDKEMEIGRNSNFLYIPIHKLKHLSLEKKKTIYVSCYDLSKSKRDNQAEIIEVIAAFLKDLHLNKESHIHIIMLMPIEEERSIYQALLQKAEEMSTVKVVFLPTVYGPWQPETMSFEAAIRKKAPSEVKKAIEAEDRLDALFVADLPKVLVELASRDEKNIQVQSEASNQWLECAQLVLEDEYTGIYKKCSRKQRGMIYTIQNKTAPVDGITMQQKHFRRWQLLKKWRELE